jgi:hypothetical protein
MNYIGFTGTQIGMTQAQRITFAMCLATLEPTALAHGDCIGSDEQAHEMALMARVPVWIFPPIDSSKRAWCQDATARGRRPDANTSNAIGSSSIGAIR